MNIHEYQAKGILKSYNLPVPESEVAFTPEEAFEIAQNMQSDEIVVKAQVHTGGRGKAGGIKFASTPEEARDYAEELIGKTLVTHQTGPAGELIEAVLLEEPSDIQHEYYLSFILDRSIGKIILMASAEGGMDIEEVSEKTPEKIFRTTIDPSIGLASYQATDLNYRLGLPHEVKNDFVKILQGLYTLYDETDCSLLEINPFVLTNDNQLVILDAKFNFDENALYRQPDIKALESKEEAESIEAEAGEYGLSYIELDGNIGCMVNGAGLAMATMDIINYYGGEPANFLDVGGGATEENVTKAFEIILSDDGVEAIFVNIFGGIMRGDVIAKGIVAAAEKLGLEVPLIVRLDGTKSEEGKQILKESGLKIISADSLATGAQKAIELVK